MLYSLQCFHVIFIFWIIIFWHSFGNISYYGNREFTRYSISSTLITFVYLHNDFSKDVKMFWMKIQNAAWFQYKNFLCCNFSFLNIFYIRARRTCFSMIRQYLFVQITRAYIFVVIKYNEWKIRIILIIDFCNRKKKTVASTATI